MHVSPLSAATYEYDAGATNFPGTLWSNGENWVGDTVPTFNNQTDLIFNTNIVVSGMRIGAARTVRSMLFGDNAIVGTNPATAIIVQTVLDNNTGTPALTFQADTGNATLTQESGFQASLLRIGVNNAGNVVLGSSLDLFTHSASKPVQFDSIVSGSGALNKYGIGVAHIYRNNTFSGGVNIFEGTIEAYDNGNALGTGAVALGGAGSSTNATLRVGNAITITNAVTVNSGSGSRTIANDSARAGNAILSGGITLNTNATFDIALVTGGTHDRLNLAGVASGSGGIVKTGTGILILSASNTYSGTTDIQGGKFFLGGAGRLGSGDVTIASGANLDFGTGSGQMNIVANNISGAGEIFQNVGSTDTRFTGDVTSTGGMTINTGTVRIGNGGTTGSYSGAATVASGATLAFARSNAYTHSGTISGLGNVSKTEAGEATLTGNNSYSGVTTLFDGSLVAGDANAFGTGNITFRLEGENTGTIRYTTASAGTDWASRIKNSSGTIRLDTAGNNVTLAGIIDSSNTNGLVKSGFGTLTLGGDNTYSGATTADAGVLAVNGNQSSATGAVTISTTATLAGSGTIGGATTINGRHNPGNSPGVQTFNDGLTYATGSTLVWELTANTESGRGTSFDGVNVAGGVLSINAGVTSDLVFNAAGSTVNWNDSFWGSNRQWQIFDNVSAPTLGSANVFDTINVSEDSAFQSLATVRAGSGFSWEQIDNDVYLNYTIPEPSTYALLALGAAGLGAHVIRRRQRR